MALDGRIHNAKFTESSGGVARNIADALGKLSCNPIFISAIGEDNAGRLLCSQISHINAEHIHKPANASTAQCAVIFDGNGECKFLVGDMDIHKLITPAMIKEKEHLIKNAPLLILDANPEIEAIGAALEMASRHNVPVFFEPTDVPISKKPFESSHWNAIKYISPNITELKYIAEALGITLPSRTDDVIWESSYIAEAVANYIENVIVTLGKYGLLIARRAGAREPLMNGCNRGSIQIRHYPSGQINNLVNVSGAGDCLVSGLISAMLQDCSEEICISVGIASAHASLYSASAVPRELFNMLHKAWQSPASYTVLK